MPPSSRPAAPPVPPLRCQTVAGSGRIGSVDGSSEAATFSFPHSVLPLPDGSALVVDTNNDSVRHVSVDERGNYSVKRVTSKGFTWMRPRGLAQLPDGSVLVCDSGHNRIRMLGADGSVSVFAGSGRKGLVDGPASTAAFDNPSGVCVCADGSVLIADTGNNCIRTISDGAGAKRTVGTLAGSGRAGFIDGPSGAAAFDRPSAVLALGSPKDLGDGESVVYVADTGNHAIRTIAAATGRRGQNELSVGTLCGKPTVPASHPPEIPGAPKPNPGGHADGSFAEALLCGPSGLAVLPDGTLAVADAGNNCVRRLAVEARVVSTIAGSATREWGLVDGASADARFNTPRGIAVAPSGDIWVADSQNHCVRVLREDVHAAALTAAADADARRRAEMRRLPPPHSRASWESSLGRGPGAPSIEHARFSSVASDADLAAALGYEPDAYYESMLAASGGLGGHGSLGGGGGGDGPLMLSDISDLPSESFATDAFSAEAQLFERAPPEATKGGGGGAAEARGGWTYTGAATVTLRRAPHRAATLRVQVHTAAAAELSVLRPSQLTLRDTAFVVCSPDVTATAGFTGFGANELGLRFSTTTAAASLLAACEAMCETDEPLHAPADGAGGMPEGAGGLSGLAHHPAHVAAHAAAVNGIGIHANGGSTPRQSDPERSVRRVSGIPSLRRPRPGAEAVAADASVEARLQQAEQDVLRLSARLAERDVEAGRMQKRLEQSQSQVRARDAKVAELTRRLALLSKRT